MNTRNGLLKLTLLFALGAIVALGGSAVLAARPMSEGMAVEAAANVRVEVALGERVLRVTRDGSEVARYRIAIGKDGHPTPTGDFRIRRVIWNPSWVPPDSPWARGKEPTPPGDPNNPMGRVKIFFRDPTYYIHGTNDEQSIGRAASHGCIRMRNDDVVELARLVMEHGGEPRDPSWFRRVLNRVTDTREVRLSSPVAMRIRK